MYNRRSVDINQDEFELILDLLRQAQSETKIDQTKAFIDRLINKIKASPAYDNPIVFGYRDLSLVTSNAAAMLVDMSLDKNLSGKKLEQQECVKIALANALFMWLNGENNLKRIVGFDFIDDAYKYESDDD